jgi:hypothetical protein
MSDLHIHYVDMWVDAHRVGGFEGMTRLGNLGMVRLMGERGENRYIGSLSRMISSTIEGKQEELTVVCLFVSFEMGF